MPESWGDSPGAGGSFREFWQCDDDIYEQAAFRPVIGRHSRRQMEVRTSHRPLGSGDAEELAQCLQYRCLTGRIRADERCKIPCDLNGLRRGTETAEARNRNGLDAQGFAQFVVGS